MVTTVNVKTCTKAQNKIPIEYANVWSKCSGWRGGETDPGIIICERDDVLVSYVILVPRVKQQELAVLKLSTGEQQSRDPRLIGLLSP